MVPSTDGVHIVMVMVVWVFHCDSSHLKIFSSLFSIDGRSYIHKLPYIYIHLNITSEHSFAHFSSAIMVSSSPSLSPVYQKQKKTSS